MIKEIKSEAAWKVMFFIILFFGLALCDISNRESTWRQAYQSRVYTAPEPEWPKDVPGQPLGYGIKNLGLARNSEHWIK